jgi:hypothetical protein
MLLRNLVLLSVLLSWFLLSVPGVARGHDTPPTFKQISNPVHDELDPYVVESCYALGRLQITFWTQQNGPPTVALVLTDPRGRRIGFDPIQKKGWQELPMAQAFIDCDESDGGAKCQGIVEVCGPLSGTYSLEVLGERTGEYGLFVSARSREAISNGKLEAFNSDADLKGKILAINDRHIILLNYSRDPASKAPILLGPPSGQF